MLNGFKKDEKKIREIKKKIYKAQEKEIRAIYKEIAKEIDDEIYEGITERELHELKEDVENKIKEAKEEIENIIEKNIEKILLSTVVVHTNLLDKIDKKYKTNTKDKFNQDIYYIKKILRDDIVKGNMYIDRKSLSKRIWIHNKKTIKDINNIINTGIKNNTNVYNIAKDLEKYVNPYKKKDFKWSKIYPGSNLKVDYNAQRLARTTINHSYQKAYIETAKANPFIEYIEYNAAHNSRTCSMCSSRDGKKYKPDKVPYDHPNGNCFLTYVITDNLTDKIASMVNSMDL